RQLVEQHAEHVAPAADVLLTPLAQASAVRSGNVVVARVVVPEGAADRGRALLDRGVVLLVDSSASRGPDLEKQLALVRGLATELAARAPSAPLTVAAFDQAVVAVHRGALGGREAQLEAGLRAHGALGASDLERALVWAAGEARRSGATRVVIVGDGLATAGSAELQRLRGAARSLASAGVARLDFVAEGELRGDATMRALTASGLAEDGMVIEGARPPAEIARRLALPARSRIQVGLPGATWLWPTSFDGVQAGDERFVIAELPAGAPAVVHVDGHATALAPVTAPAALLGRVLAKAKVDALVAQGEARGYDDALRDRIVTLARTKRVPSPFTAFLVTESEADRAALLRPPPPFVAPAPPPPPPAPAAPPPTPAPPPTSSGHGRIMASHVAPRPPQIRMAMCMVSGRLPAENIQQIVRQNFGRFRGCYDVALLQHGHVEGRVSTTFVIDHDGSVRSAASAGSEIDDPTLVACIAAAFREIHFPKPEGGIITVTYPLLLHPLESDGTLGEALEEIRASERSLLPIGIARRAPNLRPFSYEPGEPPPPPSPWTGAYAETRAALDIGDASRALAVASEAHARDARDVIALLALGEALDAAALPALAARAYGSIADLYPHDAAMLRVAAGRLEALGVESLPLAIELWRRAKDDRPDHPAAHHALALALLRAGAYAEALDTLEAALARTFAARFGLAHGVLGRTHAFVASAWRAADPSQAEAIDARGHRGSVLYPLAEPSLDFVLSWETDASDLDLRLTTRMGKTTGARLSTVDDGYGPELSTVAGSRQARRPTHAQVKLARRGPGGLPMGLVQVMEQDGRGHVSVRPRPFVLMNEGAELDLGAFD
ncbi:MAG TPA: AgmX/PglI C-terminal domain-containing protein, partial [Labilithrix sp.]|nr:AgmX/PglI C-terminal domain-containing protein [Labilithrix sp.]